MASDLKALPMPTAIIDPAKMAGSMAALIGFSAGAGKSPLRIGTPVRSASALTTIPNTATPAGGDCPFMTVAAKSCRYRRSVGLLLMGLPLLGNRQFKRVASIQSFEQGRSRDAKVASPFRNGFGFAIKCVTPTNATIVHLNLAARPAAIIRRVRSVIVDPVKSLVRTWLAHIGEEVLELSPALTYSNPAPSVVAEEPAVRVEAALPHVVPDAMNPSSAHAVLRVRRVKRRRSSRRTPLVFAAARNDPSFAKGAAQDALFGPAVAADLKVSPIFRHPRDRQQAKSRTRRNINSLDHNCTLVHQIRKGKCHAF